MPDADERRVLAKALGLQLTRVRREAGLTQEELAGQLSAAGPRTQSFISQLETGRLDNPSLGLVADYLRACRAGFRDIVDVLDEYTGLPTIAEMKAVAEVEKAVAGKPLRVQRAALRYDARSADARRASGGKPEPAEKRVRRSVRFARALEVQAVLEDRLQAVYEELALAEKTSLAKLLSDFGRRVLAILERGGRGQEQVIAKARERMRQVGLVPEPVILAVERAVRSFHAEVRESGGRQDAGREGGS